MSWPTCACTAATPRVISRALRWPSALGGATSRTSWKRSPDVPRGWPSRRVRCTWPSTTTAVTMPPPPHSAFGPCWDRRRPPTSSCASERLASEELEPDLGRAAFVIHAPAIGEPLNQEEPPAGSALARVVPDRGVEAGALVGHLGPNRLVADQ